MILIIHLSILIGDNIFLENLIITNKKRKILKITIIITI